MKYEEARILACYVVDRWDRYPSMESSQGTLFLKLAMQDGTIVRCNVGATGFLEEPPKVSLPVRGKKKRRIEA